MLLTDGSGTYAALSDFSTIVTDVAVSHRAVVGDFDGNGNPNDVYVLNAATSIPTAYAAGADAVQLYLANEAGGHSKTPAGEALNPLAPRPFFSKRGGLPRSAVLGDFDGDGSSLDIFIVNSDIVDPDSSAQDGEWGWGMQNTLLIAGASPKQQRVTNRGGSYPDPIARSDDSLGVVVGDFDCDGLANDFYVFNGHRQDTGGRENELLLVDQSYKGGYRTVPPGDLPGNPAVTISRNSQGGCVGDFNADGYDDIFVTNILAPNQILLNTCDGTKARTGVFSSTDIGTSTGRASELNEVNTEEMLCNTGCSRSCVVGDFNGDGNACVVNLPLCPHSSLGQCLGCALCYSHFLVALQE